jgi:cytochrome b6-f complex iron-sulfur subunit
MNQITRKEFLSQLGVSTSLILVPACLGGLTSCSDPSSGLGPGGIDFTIDVSTGALASNGGYTVKDGVIVARTSSGSFIAVSAACTHEGAQIAYSSGSNIFTCPRHGAEFSADGMVTRGPASTRLAKYNTSLNGTTLRVFS